MDDLALLDLLECPVCFEKLDATAKVLPCQHTFCKPCLQRILKSQKELRCPECRTLVLGSIEQLPSNLLLIRLLDGVRCGQNVPRFGSIQRSGVLSSPASIRRVPRGLQLHQHRLATNPRLHMEGVRSSLVLSSAQGHSKVPAVCPEPGTFSFSSTAVFEVRLSVLDLQMFVKLRADSFHQESHESSCPAVLLTPPQLCPGCSEFSVHALLQRKVPKTDCPNLQGLQVTPTLSTTLCYKANTTVPAQQLLQATKGHWSPQPEGASPKAKGAGSAPFPKGPDSRRKSLRQFSLTTALNTLNRMVHAERPALHISSPVLISSSNPSVPTQGSERAQPPCGAPLQVSTSYYPSPGPLGPPAAIVTLPHLQQQGPAYLYVGNFLVQQNGGEGRGSHTELGVLLFPCGTHGRACPRAARPGVPRRLRWHRQLSPFFSHRKSSLSDSKMPSLYTSWTLSTSSLSSQGSVSEPGPRQSRALRPLLLPVPVPAPGRSAAAPAPLRRGRGSARRNGSLQRPGQAGTPVQITSSLRRPSAAGRPQHFQLYPHGSSPPHSVPAGAGVDEAARPNFSYEASPALLVRGGESRSPSVCSSVILDAKEPPVKSEAAPKPPASAPPSILVKPESSRNSAEKQVKTVRFQNHSPPPPKRH
ncbi:SH3R2 ligase, partial [Erythrocercus mccallii]|nr:SH3R2 ligase [Erythrocercus mccallii]